MKKNAKFFEQIYENPENGCWEWTGHTDKDGYGRYAGQKAHRVAYFLAHPEASVRLAIDHLCYNRKCVRPTHLEGVETKENLNRRRGYKPSVEKGIDTHEPRQKED